MTMSQADFLADALSRGSALIGEASQGQQQSIRNDAWSAFCQTLLTPAEIRSPELKKYTERLRGCCHINFCALQERSFFAFSCDVGCSCPSFEGFHSVISDSQGGAASGWND